MHIRQWQIALLWFALLGSAMAQMREVRLEDNSDWWSWIKQDSLPEGLKPQSRKPADSNFQVLDLTLGADFDRVRSRFGQAIEVTRGDAAVGRHQVCYVSDSGRIHAVFEVGEVDSVLYLFENGPDWNGSELCARSAVVSANFSTKSGLKLGLSTQQVQTVLGKPNIATTNKLVYYFEFKKKTSAEGLVQLRKDNPNMSETEFNKNFDYLDVDAYIEARFASGRLNYLVISRSEVY